MKRQRKRLESSEKSLRVLEKLKHELSPQGRRTSRVKE